MAKELQYTSIDRILSKIYRDLGLEEISEIDVIEWTGEALELMGVITLYEQAVAFIEIENHQADLPNGLHSIIQVAKNNKWTKKDPLLAPANALLDYPIQALPPTEIPTNTTLEPVVLDCKGTPLTDYDLAYYRPYFDLQYEYSGWNRSNLFVQDYTPVRLANHTFFNTIVCDEDPKIYGTGCTLTDEYSLKGDKIITSFPEGSIALAYFRQKIDKETGYPMVPDEISVITAITYYITWKYMSRLWYMGREGYGDKMKESESQWQWYVKQATTKQKMLKGIDEYQNFTEGRFQLIPRRNKYYGFFGKLGKEEYTNFKDPNRRNFRFRGI